MKISFILVLFLLSVAHQQVYQKYYDEAFKIAVAMSIDQKIGQTIQADFYSITTKKNVTQPTLAKKYFFGSLLVGGDAAVNEEGNLIDLPDDDEKLAKQAYANNTLQRWQKLAAKFDYSITVKTNEGKTYDIKPVLGTDAVHNNQHISGSILFPHNIGLSCTHNPSHFYNSGKWTAKNVKQSGFNYAFAPTVAVSHNPQWGRFYETMGQDEDMVYKYAQAFTMGLQGREDQQTGVLGSAKHFMGDGATMYGADEGNAHVGNFKSFLSHNAQGFNGSISAGVGSVMCSYSAINWVPLSLSPLLLKTLRNDLDFDGFIISDYDELTKVRKQKLPTSFQKMNGSDEAASSIINAGIDMVMIPGFYGPTGFTDYIDGVKASLQYGSLSEQRLNDAVARILSVKMALGLTKLQQGSEQNIRKAEDTQQEIVSESTEYEDSLEAVHESLVLLKNANVIPVKTSALEYIVLVGEKIININSLLKNELFKGYDNIGMQSGGWSLRWQGFEGNSQWQGENKQKSNASSIMDALINLKQNFKLVYPNYTTVTEKDRIQIEREQYLNQLRELRKKMNSRNTLILAAVGESPYAQFCGDVGIPYCMNETVLPGEGCLFDDSSNPYLGDYMRQSLKLEFNKFEKDVISRIREEDKNIPLLTVLFAGRPMLIDEILSQSSAVLDAFLPGTSGGQGVIDAITGAYVIRPNGQSDAKNSLSFDWPKSHDQLKKFPVYQADGSIPKIDDPLFKAGYGLSSFTGILTQ